ncbi:flagellar hook-associated protein FlgK [Limimaricola hongkongensis]|uniref:Flagellar hook-associated protein 1 n=1 Tax=Limimaricola hongkongensis DSM 17492 TaxID=1122180 RepID=A0A017HHP4_9RHOB|nr:flagellar hook-associated protein FlgK [Limimaricola hongkongensis]EYD73663.1 Flagellar hook-associated protein FlgK [Limimaricola hongkongensis DSM 17492]
MSITSAFTSARSGLAAAESWAELTSGNIANATREGYARRAAPLVGQPGGGVAASGIQRAVDDRLDQSHRIEISRVAGQEAIAGALETYAATLGQVGDGTNLSDRLSALQVGLDTLASNPSEPAIQQDALRAATGLASGLRETASALEGVREQTAAGVMSDVGTINATLREVVDLNRRISQEPGPTQRRAGLEDSLSKTLDGLAEVLDLRVSRDDKGRISVATTGGAMLVENDTAHELEFDVAAASLSVNGVDVTPGTPGARGSQEGRLAARLDLLGSDLPRMQRQLDEMAGALMRGFEDADPSVGAGQPGLFTDAGAGFDAAQIDGLAQRIEINPAVRADQGGGAWRLRDGIGAIQPGPAGYGGLADAFSQMLSDPMSFDAAAGLGTQATAADFAGSLLAEQQGLRNDARDRAETLGAGRDAVAATRAAAQGVNIDDELQQLMLIEQSYAANATVMRTLDEMMDTLLNAVR